MDDYMVAVLRVHALEISSAAACLADDCIHLNLARGKDAQEKAAARVLGDCQRIAQLIPQETGWRRKDGQAAGGD